MVHVLINLFLLGGILQPIGCRHILYDTGYLVLQTQLVCVITIYSQS